MLPLRYCAQCNTAFSSSHPTKRFCTIMCQVKYARQAKTIRDRGQQLSGGELAAREQAIKDAIALIPRQEGQPQPPAPQVSPRIAPFEAEAKSNDTFLEIAKDFKIPTIGAPTTPSTKELTPEDPEFWKEGEE